MTYSAGAGAAPEGRHDGATAAYLGARIDALLRLGMWRRQIPGDIKLLVAARARKAARRIAPVWCFAAAGMVLLHGMFDFALFPPAQYSFLALGRLALAGCLVLAGVMAQRDLAYGYPVIGLACVLTVVFGGLAGLRSGDPMLLCRYLNDAQMLGLTAIIFAGRDLRFNLWVAACCLAATAGFLLVSGISPPAARWQLICFDGCDFAALIFGRQVQNRLMERLFLLTIREELRNSEAALRQHQLSSIAYTDKLTELPNRRYFDEICASISDGTKNLLPLSVCMIDIDHFKKLNDSCGHLQGDRCLKLIGAAIRKNLRGRSDIVARYGGEEFVLLLPGTDAAMAVEVAERVREGIFGLDHANPGAPGGVVTASIGVAAVTRPPVDVEALLQAADQALYRAKAAGRNRVCA
jgi:diguanylate cyclase (GGDEF)-like protein